VPSAFGIDAQPHLVAAATQLPAHAWQPVPRQAPAGVPAAPRQRPAHVKQEVVVRKGYTDPRLLREAVAEPFYRPGVCRQRYRIVALRKHLVLAKKGPPIQEVRPFFYLTNEWARGRRRSCLSSTAAATRRT
jgi:hypothetical protein